MEIKELKVPLRVEPDFEAQDDIIQIEKPSEDIIEVPQGFADKVPAHWTIVPCEAGINCVNVSSREVFEGTVEEFNKLLKG